MSRSDPAPGEETLGIGHAPREPRDRETGGPQALRTYRCSATTATCWRRWLLCLVWACALGSALLSISRLNCHPGNLRGEPQLGEGPTEASPSSRAGSVPPHFSRKPVCRSPHVSPLPSASGADSVHLTHSLGTRPPAVCCGVTRVSLPPPRPSCRPALLLASRAPWLCHLQVPQLWPFRLFLMVSSCVRTCGGAPNSPVQPRIPEKLSPRTTAGATHLTPTSLTHLPSRSGSARVAKPSPGPERNEELQRGAKGRKRRRTMGDLSDDRSPPQETPRPLPLPFR